MGNFCQLGLFFIGPQIITGQKTFQSIKIFGDIFADSVNSYDLQELYEDTLLTVGNQTVKGRKVIHVSKKSTCYTEI